jgi:phosphoribosyl-AMP cyclohydrolase
LKPAPAACQPAPVVSEEFVSRWVERLRREVPDAVAIFLGGSQLRGDAGPYSDVDFDIVVATGPRDEWPGWYETTGDRLVLVSTWIRDLETWLAAAKESQEWAFRLPCADPLRLCWVADESWRERLGLIHMTYPPGEPEMDHFEGAAGKVANAWHHGDELALRLAAQDLAGSVVSLLRPLNPRPPVHSRQAALRSLLDFDVVPAGYRDDMLTCLGLRGEAPGPDVHIAARRLAGGVLELLHSYESTFTGLIPEHSAESLRDGSLRRYVEQALGDDGKSVDGGLSVR